MTNLWPEQQGEPVLTVATLFWQANEKGQSFSSMYDEGWVEKLYRGFSRNLTVPFRFVCYTDRPRSFIEPIAQRQIRSARPGYADCIQPYEIEGPMILVGLDTIVCGDCDGLADYCVDADRIALPRDPYNLAQACNGVALIPPGWTKIGREHRGENDMEWVRRFPHAYLDDAFPGQVVSFKGHVEKHGVGDARIVYFHGERKPHQLADHPLVKEHWL
jgi:hypothetical protein